MTTTRIVTREYDAEGRLVREVETTTTTPTYYPATQWWQPLPQTPYTVTCGGSLTTTASDYRLWN